MVSFLALVFGVLLGSQVFTHVTSGQPSHQTVSSERNENSEIQALKNLSAPYRMQIHDYKSHKNGKLHADRESHPSLRNAATKRSTINVKAGANKALIKRGFLANLATLLNDAEALSVKRNESALSSISSYGSPSNPPSVGQKRGSTDDNTAATTPPSSQISENIPTVQEVQSQLNSSGQDSAPIFAFYHGKIVPLGNLPDSSFRKSHSELRERTLSLGASSFPNRESPEREHTTFESSTHVAVASSRHEIPQEKHVSPTSGIVNRPSEIVKTRTSSEDRDVKLSKLESYLTNLDGHTPPTGLTKSTRGVAKDEVVFPEAEKPATKSSIISHVKGFVLDNGKVVSVDSKSEGKSEEKDVPDPPASGVDSSEKFYVTDDGTLYPLTKSKPETADAVARDTLSTGEEDGKKTVTVSLDMLKDLLRKTDTKISLAQLLNKGANAEEKSDVTEDDDPGTIEDFAAGGLKAHNEYRKKHHDGDLLWSDDLAAKAQKLAESLADKKTLEIAKDLEKEGYGENVAKVWATFKNAGEAATKMWYTQSENYRFDDPHLDENTGQFAQVIWKSTKELGMGVAKSIDDVNNKYVYVVALYRPPGNIEAQLRDNVLPTGNNTVDVYSTFFKRSQEVASVESQIKRSHLITAPSPIVDELE